MKISILILTMVLASQVMTSQTMEDKIAFTNMLNAYRIAAGVRPVVYYILADTLAKVRINTAERHIDSQVVDIHTLSKAEFREHVHHGFEDDLIWFNKEIVPQDTTLMAGAECSGYLTAIDYEMIADDIVGDLFIGWKNSKDHWNGMMSDEYTHIAIAWRRTTGGFIPVLLLMDKALRSPENIGFFKYTDIAR